MCSPSGSFLDWKILLRSLNHVGLLGCYLWSKEIAAAFFPLLQVLEITLRNSIHKEASQALGEFWFDNVAIRPTRNPSNQDRRAQQRAVDQHIGSIRKARQGIRRDLHLPNSAQISEDRIVAKVTFGFWANLFNAAFHCF